MEPTGPERSATSALSDARKVEETGGYFEDVLKAIEKNAWMKEALPWGKLSRYPGIDACESDDGPIMWVCPGEQIVSITDLQAGPGTAPGQKKKRSVLDRLTNSSRNEKQREKLIEDRTGCHADMAGYFPDRHPVAAVGFVQCVDSYAPPRPFTIFFFRSHPPHTHSGGGSYALKDIVAFHAEDMDRVADECGLDFQEEAKDQLTDPTFWADEARLNQLRRLGIRFAKIRLHGGDVYCIPRKVVHQFQTVSGCISVTWHLKYTRYQKNMAGLEVPSLAKSSAATNGAPRPPKRPFKKAKSTAVAAGLDDAKNKPVPDLPFDDELPLSARLSRKKALQDKESDS